MSLILDAINKSEQQRPPHETVPGVGTLQEAGAAAGPSPWRRLLWPAITTVLAVLVIVLWWDSRQPVAVAPAPIAQPAAPALSEPVPSIPVAEPVADKVAPLPIDPVAEPPPPVGDTDVASLYAPVVAVDDSAAVPESPRIAEVEVVEVERIETASPVSEPTPLDVEAIALAAQKALAEQGAASAEPVVEHAVPLISELKQRTKDEIPSIFFSSHHWSNVAAERQVTLNGEIHREGDLIKPGLRLVEILDDSIVLDYRGTEFRLRSLNSWVNL